MPTFGISSRDEKRFESMKSRYLRLQDSMKGKPTIIQVMEHLLDLAEGSRGKEVFKDTPQSVQDLIEFISCEFLKIEGSEFKCFEHMDEKKSPAILGTDLNWIKTRCETCKIGKANKIREQYRKKLRGKNIKGLLQLINLFQKFAEDGIPSTVYFCNRIPDSQIFTGLKTMECTMYDKDIPVDRCKEGPCKYFEEYTIAVQQEFPEQTLQLIEGITDDYKMIEDLSPKKQVESEQVDPDV